MLRYLCLISAIYNLPYQSSKHAKLRYYVRIRFGAKQILYRGPKWNFTQGIDALLNRDPSHPVLAGTA